MYSAGGINWTPRIGRIRGMDIKIHLLLILLIGFWLLEGLMASGPVGLAVTGVMSVSLFSLILWHELGHAFAARRCGLTIKGIMLWPLGGECQISGGMSSPKVELKVALAGPAAHALLVVATAPVLFLSRSQSWLAEALITWWIVAVVILFFNLIPMFPLDGGRVFRALLACKLGDVAATRVAVRVGQVLAGLLVVAGLVSDTVMIAIMGGFIIFSAEQELRMVRQAGYVYNPASRNPYAAALGIREDWSRESVEGYGRPENAGFFGRLRTRRQLRKLAAETEKREKLRAEVDRILEKVSREGMPSLTANERRTLKQGSSEYRKDRD